MFTLTAALCVIAIAALVTGHFIDLDLWGMSASKCLGSAVFFPLIAVGVIAFLLTAFQRESNIETERSPNIIIAGAIVAIVGAIIIWLTSSGGFFWRNIFSGPISIFGSYNDIVRAYSDLPPDFDLIDLWQQTVFQRILAALLGGAYIFLTALLTREIFENSETRFLAFLFIATTGMIAVFSRPGDFAIMLVLMILNAYLTILFFKGKTSFYVAGIVLLISAVFHPVFVLFAASILYVRLSGKLLDGGKAGLPILMLIILAILSAALSLLQIEPFTSVFRPETSASPVFGSAHIWGLANQLMMVSHFIWLLSLITCIYAFISARVTDLHGMLFGAWFIASSSFYAFSYSHYGWVFGYPAIAIVVLPSVLWLAYFMVGMSPGLAKKSLTLLIIVNVLTTVQLLAAVSSSDTSVDLYADILNQDNAFNKSFEDGKGALLMGIMLSEELQDYDRALPYLESYRQSYPLDPVGRYHYGWTLTNMDGKLVKGVDVLKKVEEYLTGRGKLFWEFNYRIGWKRVIGHNHVYGSIALERAAAENNTLEIATLLASAYENMRVWDSMASKYEQMIALGDSSKENFHKVAIASASLEDSTTAFEYFKYGIEHFPNYMDNYEYMARYYFEKEMYDSLEMLAEHGLKHLGHSVELEASMILVYHYTGRLEQRDSLYTEFMDYFRTYPTALYNWGIFLEENGLEYQGRKMQAADMTVNHSNLRVILGYYHYYRKAGKADSARAYIDSFIEYDSTGEFSEITDAVRHFDTILWPDDRFRRDSH
jgi:tetratricopeptide (TPR) repeat protein